MNLAHAALLPLDYAADRDDVSLTYVSFDWEELAELICDPVSFFRMKETCWPQSGDEIHAWKLGKPTAIVLNYAGDGYGRALATLGLGRSLSARQSTSADADTIHVKGVQPYKSTDEDKAPDQASIISELKETFPQGGFVAEFALKTRIVVIDYIPNPELSGAKKKQLRFDGGFTNSTMVTFPTNFPDRIAQKGKRAKVHVDLGSSPVQRAQFALDFLENAGFALTKATSHPDHDFRKGDAIFVKKGGKIKSNHLSADVSPVFDLTDMYHPSLVIEGASMPYYHEAMVDSDDDECLVCCEATIITIDGKPHIIVNGVLKCYTAPVPPIP